MLRRDLIRLAIGAVRAQRLRSGLTALGIAVGVSAVVLLTSIGEGVQRFVLGEFTQFGTTVLSVTPGRKATLGASMGSFGSIRPLTIDDAEALLRARHVESTEGMVQGNAAVEYGKRSRRVAAMGVGPAFPRILGARTALGSFLPPDDPRSPRPFAVLGAKLHRELFRNENPLGKRIRIGGSRYRVVGVMEPKGQFLGFDLDDSVFIPAARGLELFNREGLMEIHVLYGPDDPVDQVMAGVRRVLIERHGTDDFSMTTQDQMLDTLGDVLGVLTLAVGALGAISLFVGGVGILTVMTISVRERTSEIGLLRTLGAPRRQILALFLGEATLLAAAGGLVGLVAGIVLGQLLSWLVPALPVQASWIYALLAEGLAATVGLAAGAVPAVRAAALDPVEALRAE